MHRSQAHAIPLGHESGCILRPHKGVLRRRSARRLLGHHGHVLPLQLAHSAQHRWRAGIAAVGNVRPPGRAAVRSEQIASDRCPSRRPAQPEGARQEQSALHAWVMAPQASSRAAGARRGSENISRTELSCSFCTGGQATRRKRPLVVRQDPMVLHTIFKGLPMGESMKVFTGTMLIIGISALPMATSKPAQCSGDGT
eukprot:scaffold15440_cov139-Isochrysis_galbana.AAC.4